MINEIKAELERESDDFQLTAPRLRKHVYDLIDEVKRKNERIKQLEKVLDKILESADFPESVAQLCIQALKEGEQDA